MSNDLGSTLQIIAPNCCSASLLSVSLFLLVTQLYANPLTEVLYTSHPALHKVHSRQPTCECDNLIIAATMYLTIHSDSDTRCKSFPWAPDPTTGCISSSMRHLKMQLLSTRMTGRRCSSLLMKRESMYVRVIEWLSAHRRFTFKDFVWSHRSLL